MDNTIKLTDTVYQLIKKYPEVKDILVELGFKPLNNPIMFNTLARTTSLLQAARIANLPLELIIQQLEWNGYEVDKGVPDDK